MCELDTGTRHFGEFGAPTKNTPGTGTGIPRQAYPWKIVLQIGILVDRVGSGGFENVTGRVGSGQEM